MLPCGKRQYRLRYLGMALLCWCTVCGTAASARGAGAGDATPIAVEQRLERGKGVEQSLRPEEVHQYMLKLSAGESVSVLFKRHGTPLAATLFAPDGTKLQQFSSSFTGEGEEKFNLVAQDAGIYRIEVHGPPQQKAAGRYEVVLLEQGRGIADESPAKPSSESCREKDWLGRDNILDIAQILNGIGDCMAVVGGKAGDQQGNTRSLVDFTRAEVALLISRWHRGDAVSAAYQESLQGDFRALALAEQEKDRKRAYEVMREVADDLQIKAKHASRNVRGLGKDVTVRVTTRRGGRPSPGWVVYYRPRASEVSGRNVVQRFQKVTPTQQTLPPGRYLMWVGTPTQPETPKAQKQLVEVGGGRSGMKVELAVP